MFCLKGGGDKSVYGGGGISTLWVVGGGLNGRDLPLEKHTHTYTHTHTHTSTNQHNILRKREICVKKIFVLEKI